VRAVWGQAKADFLERYRRFSFIAMVALSIFAAFWFVPTPQNSGGFIILEIQPDLFIQGGNASWIPIASALGLAFLLPMVGFFYLRNAIAFDEKTGIEQLVSTSGAGTLCYLFGKFISGILLLYALSIVVIVGSFFMTVWHFPGEFLSLHDLLNPYMFILASLPLCVAFSVLFGSLRFLRGAFGSVIYVFGALTFMALSIMLENSGIIFRSFDITTMSSLMEIVFRTVYEQTGYPVMQFTFMGGIGNVDMGYSPTHQLVFNGLNFNPSDYAVFGMMLLISIGCVLLSVPLYGIRKLHTKQQQTAEVITHRSEQVPSYNAVIPSKKQMWGRGIFAEIKLALKGRHFLWYAVSLVGIALSLFLNIDIVREFIAPLLMLWAINVFSGLGSREHENGILHIIATIPGGKFRQILYSWIAGFFVAFLFSLPIIIRLLLAGQFIGVFAIFAGVIFLPSFAMFLGEFTGTNRAFEVLFIIMTYTIINGVTIFMYMGNPSDPSFYQAVFYLIAGIVLGIFAILKRTQDVLKLKGN